MKALLKILAICLPFLIFSQKTDTLSVVAKNTAEIILKEQKTIDSVKILKEKEFQKQMTVLKKIRERIVFLKAEKKIKVSDNYKLANALEKSSATKQDNDIIYWEEVKRKWTGRLFNKDSVRVRMFRYEDGVKKYLD